MGIFKHLSRNKKSSKGKQSEADGKESSRASAATVSKAKSPPMEMPDGMGEKDVDALVKATHFSNPEVKALWSVFKVIAGSQEDDNLIDMEEFQGALGLKKSVFTERMFRLFDDNGDDGINFEEFVKGLSIFKSDAPMDDKLKFSFRIYDFDQDGSISRSELTEMVKTLVEQMSLNLTPADIEQVIETTFTEADQKSTGSIDFEEYRALCQNHPHILDNMTIKSLSSLGITS